MKKFKNKVNWIAVVLGIAVFAVVSSGLHVVRESSVAVALQFGKVIGLRDSGVHWDIPFIVEYKVIDLSQSKIESEFSTSTRDMQTITQVIAVQYVVDASKAEELYLKFLGNHENSIIVPFLSEVVQSVTSRYTIEEFVSRRSEVSDLMESTLKSKLAPYGINVISVDILDHDFSDAYEAAVEAKKVAEQKVEQAEFEKQQAEIQAETQKILSQSMDENVKFKMFLEKWDGHLPQVLGDGDFLNFLIDYSTDD
ncbi:MAG: prohibitin family protein [Erysipelotrichaceae bacterium]|jgi:regulator of protease activity HflC (stomatin/prohibitin superfamily)|nr:prohibitin family protein [Erysipelotrichaceae bacterium]